MQQHSIGKALVNPRPQAVRLILSDGTERVIAPWGLAVVPRTDSDGQPIEVIRALVLERRSIPGLAAADRQA
jgi:hypothetical protein